MTGRQLVECSQYWRQNGKGHKLHRVCTASSPPVHKREIFVRTPKDLALEIYQEAYNMFSEGSNWMGEPTTASVISYLVWSPFGLRESQPISHSALQRWFATLRGQHALHRRRTEGDVLATFSRHPKAFQVAPAGSTVRDASEYRLCARCAKR